MNNATGIVVIMCSALISGVLVLTPYANRYLDAIEKQNEIAEKRLVQEKKQANIPSPTTTPTPKPTTAVKKVQATPTPTPEKKYVPIEIGEIRHECEESSISYLKDLNSQWVRESKESADCIQDVINDNYEYHYDMSEKEFDKAYDQCESDLDFVISKIKDAEKKYCTFCAWCK